MTRHFQNAQFLYQQNRVPEAEAELKKSLSQNPNDPFALGLYAACRINQKDFPKAIELAEKAVGIQPSNPNLFYILSRSYFYNQKIGKAKEAIEEGQRLAPNDPSFFIIKSEIEFYQEHWKKALEEANRGLEIDAENVDLINLRAQALVKLNRQDEAAATLDYALNKAPENTYSHSNKGWVAIEKDEYDKAIEHFKEALRFDPTNRYAKSGLKEAIKGKNIFYRMVLKYFLWMDKMQEKGRWFFIIGIYLLYLLLLEVYEKYPEFGPILLPFIVFYVIFAFSTWIAKPISNLFLRLHPLGKNALSEDEIMGSNITGLLAAGSLLMFISFFASDNLLFAFLGGFLGFMMIPAGGTFGVPPETKARKYMALYSFILGGIGALWFLMPQFSGLVWAFGLGIFFYSWVANYLISLEAKRFG